MDLVDMIDRYTRMAMIRLVVVAALALVLGINIGYKTGVHRAVSAGHPIAAYGVGEDPDTLPPGSAPQPGKMVRDPLPPYVKPLGALEKPEKPFVLVRVTDLTISFGADVERPDGKSWRLLNIHAEGIVPKSGYLAEMLLPRSQHLTPDGYLEYFFQAIPNVEDGVEGPTRIIADGQFSFHPDNAEFKGVRVFGCDGTYAEKSLPPPRPMHDGREIIGTFPPVR